MTEELIKFETALKAKEKGFNWECRETYSPDSDCRTLNYYEGDGSGWFTNSNITEEYTENFDIKCVASTQSLLQRWLREVHKIHIEILYGQKANSENEYCYYTTIQVGNKNKKTLVCNDDYEEALENALFQALNLIP